MPGCMGRTPADTADQPAKPALNGAITTVGSKCQQRDGGLFEVSGHWNPEYNTIARIPSAFGTRPIEQHFSRPVNPIVDARATRSRLLPRECLSAMTANARLV